MLRQFADDATRLPGPYGNTALASIKRRSTTAQATGTTDRHEESWLVRIGPKATFKMDLAWETTQPTRYKTVSKVYSSVTPGFYRVYRADRVTDVVKSEANGTDHMKRFSLGVSIPEYASLFANAHLVAVMINPIYVRDVFLPGSD